MFSVRNVHDGFVNNLAILLNILNILRVKPDDITIFNNTQYNAFLSNIKRSWLLLRTFVTIATEFEVTIVEKIK